MLRFLHMSSKKPLNRDLLPLLRDYITERYGPGAAVMRWIAAYQLFIEKEGLEALVVPAMGFLTYRMEGDACVIYDIFTHPAFRRSGACLELFKRLLRKAETVGCYVIIGLRETGFNRDDLGLKAMQSVGFVEQPNSEGTVFLRHGVSI